MARIFVIGSGVVGTATGKGFAYHGHQVTFVDIDDRRIEALRAEGFAATDRLNLADSTTPAFIFLSLPTPNVGLRYDLTAFDKGTKSVGEALRTAEGFHTVVVRSTVPPGTTENRVKGILEETSGKKVGEGFALGSNPEFLRVVSAREDFLTPWMTVVGSRSRRTVDRLLDLYAPFPGEIRTFSDPTAVELVKCANNLFNATKISFWNELWQVGAELDVDVDEVAKTVALAAEGSLNPYYGIRGGAPYGGACLPKDTAGFAGFARELGVATPLLHAVIDVNERITARLAESQGQLSAVEDVTPHDEKLDGLRSA